MWVWVSVGVGACLCVCIVYSTSHFSCLLTFLHRKDFEHFVNLNPRSPEYLSLYIDEMLKKGVKEVGLHWRARGRGRC